ncbi:hypothetical protein SDC9_203152 [bioreactor metagenome]|uniref:Uncharacterized protein n=1 Tax=bioreactor metagenome TaxID=1076179 RepID=A0A645IX46_9ZZZZ
MQVYLIGNSLVGLRQRKRDGRAARRLDDEGRAALLQTLDEIQRLGEVDDGGVGTGAALAAREAFPERHLGTDQEVFIVHCGGDLLDEIVSEAAAIFPRAAVLPFAVVIRTQYLGTEIPVAQLEVNAICACIVRDLGA